MGLWPFGNKDGQDPEDFRFKGPAIIPDNARYDTDDDDDFDDFDDFDDSESDEIDYGPFDGETVDYEMFDFSDFSDGPLDLGSVKMPMPRPSEVQVEMGPDGPRMVHLVTQFGRVTPVAFASTTSGGLWAESMDEILEGMRNDGLEPHIESGPWGDEIVGNTEYASIRMIGVEGPRWTLRVTMAAPIESANQMAELGREIISRTFVYRGDQPMLAGSVLPVVMPAALAAQVQQAMEQRVTEDPEPEPPQVQASRAVTTPPVAKPKPAAKTAPTTSPPPTPTPRRTPTPPPPPPPTPPPTTTPPPPPASEPAESYDVPAHPAPTLTPAGSDATIAQHDEGSALEQIQAKARPRGRHSGD